ncbi:MAG: hypothetical protein ACK559_14485, partial [bacterium]
AGRAPRLRGLPGAAHRRHARGPRARLGGLGRPRGRGGRPRADGAGERGRRAGPGRPLARLAHVDDVLGLARAVGGHHDDRVGPRAAGLVADAGAVAAARAAAVRAVADGLDAGLGVGHEEGRR